MGKRTTSQMAGLVRELLIAAGLPAVAAGRFSAHSAKATVLSWAAKFGASSGLRRLLGGHAKVKDRVVLEYSRDALAPAMIFVAELYSAIRAGRFLPDATRSGRFANAAPRTPLVRAGREPQEDRWPSAERSAASGTAAAHGPRLPLEEAWGEWTLAAAGAEEISPEATPQGAEASAHGSLPDGGAGSGESPHDTVSDRGTDTESEPQSVAATSDGEGSRASIPSSSPTGECSEAELASEEDRGAACCAVVTIAAADVEEGGPDSDDASPDPSVPAGATMDVQDMWAWAATTRRVVQHSTMLTYHVTDTDRTGYLL